MSIVLIMIGKEVAAGHLRHLLEAILSMTHHDQRDRLLGLLDQTAPYGHFYRQRIKGRGFLCDWVNAQSIQHTADAPALTRSPSSPSAVR